MDAKVCRTCQEIKELANFSKLNRSKDGHQSQCKLCDNRFHKQWYQLNSVRKITVAKIWQQENIDRAKAKDKTWRANNPDKVRLQGSSRRARKLNAFPQWARTGEHKEAIEALYTEAKRLEVITGIAHHVDHIHPLKSNFVCGLHLAVNLRVITATINLSKGNKFTPYVESEVVQSYIYVLKCIDTVNSNL